MSRSAYRSMEVTMKKLIYDEELDAAFDAWLRTAPEVKEGIRLFKASASAQAASAPGASAQLSKQRPIAHHPNTALDRDSD